MFCPQWWHVYNGGNASRLVLARLPGYDKVLKIGRSRRNPIFLSIGNGFGVDVRKAIIDGYPSDSVVATDLDDALWAVGEQLFGATQEIGRVPFLSGNFLNPYFLEAVWPFYTQSYAPSPTLSTLTSLNALHGQVSVVSTCFVFDQLNASQQLQLARGIAGLLSAESGSMVIGVHRVSPPSGSSAESHRDDSGGMFYHSPESWSDLWDGQLFQKGTVKVETILVESQELGMSGDGQVMEWTIVRL
ncbi:hypothetical protein L227DRAFT_176047 [Lentinus tigrinus ALCF2SS1-6]|uniref:Methyltransferase domain-containing protein n=1 Tax=Lentinus tigrinus ALCF2SS1-6 TaxID=1328759 RepID=A0A5C2S681_9APHY|nr:hypothetical protein L227DRAFT_176047 [Lentinus tigrinus ALCF2SS1-6]